MAELRIMQFYVGTMTSLTYVDLFTVPVGRRYIVKDINVRNVSGSSNGLYLAVGTTALYYAAIPGNGVLELKPWWVMTEGQALRAHCTVSAGFGMLVSGAHHYI
jgi:hypothetical protein